MSYRDKKRTAADLVHRRNRGKQKPTSETEDTPALDSIVDSFAASLFATPAAPAPAEPVLNEEVPEAVDHEETEFFDTDEEEFSYDEPEYVEEAEPEVAEQLQDDEPEVATLVEDEDESDDAQEANEEELNSLHSEQQQVAAQHGAMQRQLTENETLAEEKLVEQRSAIEQLRQNIEQGRSAVESLREQAKQSHAAAVQEFEDNNVTLQSLIGERNELVTEFEQQKLELQNQSQSQHAHLQSLLEQIATERAAVEERRTDLQQSVPEAIDPADIELRRAELQSIQAEHEQLETEFAEAQAHAASQHAAAAEAFKSLKEQIQQQQESLAARREELANLKAEAVPEVDATLQSEVQRLSQEAESLEAEIQQHEQTREVASREIVESEEALSRERELLQSNIAKAQSQLQALEVPAVDDQAVADHEAEVESLKAEFFQVKAAIAEATKRNDEKQQADAEAAAQHIQTVEGLKQQITEDSELLLQLEQQPAPQIESSVQAELSELQRRSELLKEQVEQARSQRFAATAAVDQQQSQLIEQRNALQESLAADELELEKLHSGLSVSDAGVSEKLEAEIGDLHAKSQAIEGEIEQARIRQQEALKQRSEAAGQQAAQQQQVIALRSAIDDKARMLEELVNQPALEEPVALDDEIYNLNEQSLVLAREIERLTNQRAAAEAEVALRGTELAEQRDGLLRSVEQQRTQLSLFDRPVTAQPTESPELQNEVQSLTAEAAELKSQIAELRKQSEEAEQNAEEERKRLKKKIKRLKKKISEDTQALTDIRSGDISDSVGEELREEVEKLDAESSTIASKLRSLTAEREEIQQALVEEQEILEAQKLSLLEKIETDQANLRQLEAEDLDSHVVVELGAKVEGLQSRSLGVQRQLDQLNFERSERKAAIEQELEQLSVRKASITSKLEEDKSALQQLMAQEVANDGVEALQSELQHLRTAGSEVADQVRFAKEKNEVAQAQIRDERETLQQEASKLRQQLEADQAQLQELQEAISDAESDETIALRSEIDALTSARVTVTDAIAARLEEAGKKKAAEEQTRLQLQEELAVLNASLASEQQQLTSLSEQSSTEPFDAEREQVEQLQKSLEEARTEIRERSAQVAAEEQRAQEEATEFQQQIDLLENEIQAAEATLSAIEEPAQPSPADLEIRKARLQSLADERDRLTAAIQAANESAQSVRTEVEEQTAAYEQQIASLQAEADSNRQALASVSQQDPDTTIQQREFEKQIEELAAEAESVRQELKAAVEEAEAAQSEVAEQEAAFAEQQRLLRESIAADRAAIQQMRLDAQQHQAQEPQELIELESERSDLAEQVSAAKQQLTEATSAAALMEEEQQEECTRLRQEIAAEKKLIQSLAQQVKSIRKQCEVTNPEIAGLVADRQRSQERLAKANEIHTAELKAQQQAAVRAQAKAVQLQAEIAEENLLTQQLMTTADGKKQSTKLAPFLPVGSSKPVSAAAKAKFESTRSKEASSQEPIVEKTIKGRSKQSKARASEKGRRRKKSTRSMQVVWCGLLAQIATLAAFAIGCCIYFDVPGEGESSQVWTSFLNSARWIVPVLWIGGQALCCLIPKESEGRSVAIGSTVAAAALTVVSLIYWQAIVPGAWIFIGVAAVLYSYLFCSFLAELCAYGEFKAAEDQCETLISATSVAALLLLVTLGCWFFGFFDSLTIGLQNASLVVFGLLSAGICAMTFRVATQCYKELKKGTW